MELYDCIIFGSSELYFIWLPTIYICDRNPNHVSVVHLLGLKTVFSIGLLKWNTNFLTEFMAECYLARVSTFKRSWSNSFCKKKQKSSVPVYSIPSSKSVQKSSASLGDHCRRTLLLCKTHIRFLKSHYMICQTNMILVLFSLKSKGAYNEKKHFYFFFKRTFIFVTKQWKKERNIDHFEKC